LSKKQVNVDDEKEGESRYANSTQLHSILIHIAEKTKVSIYELYQNYIWPLYHNKKYDHPLTLLKNSMMYE
jgi:translation initiation factor 2 subunit 1